MSDTISLADFLRSHGQDHLLAHWDAMSEPQRAALAAQVRGVDLPALRQQWQARGCGAGESGADMAARATGPSQLIRQPATEAEREQWRQAAAFGEGMLAAGKVGSVIVAGGQGTRLGFDKPKGMFPVGPVSGVSLFQIFAEQVIARVRRAGRPIPFLVMTSDATAEETEQYFKLHKFFGLPPETVFFFRQGNMPAVDADTGRLLLDSGYGLVQSPDGHGGILAALKTSGALAFLAQFGVDYLYYHQVDNPTAIVCDPALLGWHALRGADLTTKVVAKTSPTEKMGVVCEVDGATQIIEYSDLPADLAPKTDAHGKPVFWAGNMAIHVFNRALLENLSEGKNALPFHLAHKAVPHLNEKGERVAPVKPNAIKFEKFIFDTLPRAAVPLVVEADRAREFNPVKNATGTDSPQTAKAAVSAVGTAWLEEAGAVVAPGTVVEISPQFALDADDVRRQVAPGTKYTGEVYLR